MAGKKKVGGNYVHNKIISYRSGEMQKRNRTSDQRKQIPYIRLDDRMTGKDPDEKRTKQNNVLSLSNSWNIERLST